jgi:uncharacterized delta-60 repeat protein
MKRILALFLLCFTAALHAAPGDLDSLNSAVVGTNVLDTAVQADGKIIIAGTFTSVGGTARSNIARLNTDGSLDTTFDPRTNGTVRTVAVQADGKILLGGEFSTLQPNGAPSAATRNRIARVNADGTLDTGFNPDASGIVFSIAVQTDGKILLGGAFTQVNSIARSRIARLNADGTLDSNFQHSPNHNVLCVAVQADGKILLGGQFSHVQLNTPPGTFTARSSVVRFNADGTLDTTFNPNANQLVNHIAVQSDGKILLGGFFSTLQPNGAASPTTRNYIARVNADGSLDTGFDPNANNEVSRMVVQSDGKILLGGVFTTLQPNAGSLAFRNYFVRLNANGTLDTSFDPNPNSSVRSIALQSDGKILLGGAFTSLQPNGGSATNRNLFARLINDAPVIAAPTVTTPTSASVTAASATLGGNVTTDGGAAVTARGVVYSLTAENGNPQISGTGVTNVIGTGTTGVFTVNATGLAANSAYSYAAYATNSTGTSYSSVGTFATTSTFDTPGASPMTYSGVITGAVGVTKTGTAVLTLTGANDYTGTTTVSAGALNIQNNTALGTVDGGTSVTAGAALQMENNITTSAEPLTLNGTGVSADGALRNISGNNDFTGPVTLGSATRINSDAGTLTLSNTGTITGSGLGLTVGGASNTTIASIIGTGSGTLTKDGGGTLTLSGSAANTATGTTAVSGGTLIAGKTAAVAIAGDVIVGDGTGVDVLQLSGSGGDQIANTSILTFNGTSSNAGTFRLNGKSETVGGLVGSGGAGIVENNTSGTSTLTLDVNSTNRDFSGILQDGVSGTLALTKTGTATQTLSGTNTYTGATTVSAGILNIQNATGLGTAAGGTTVSNGATLQLQGGITVGAEDLSLNGGAASGQTGALVNVSGTNTYGGAVTVTSSSSISAASGSVLNLTGGVVKNGTVATFNGGGTINVNTVAISGSSANSDLVVDGTTVNLGVANTYNGPTFIRNTGRLNANVVGALPTATRSALTFDGTGTSVLTLGAAQSVASLTAAGAATVTLGSNTLTVGTSTGSTTFAGAIGGTGGLTKDGASTQVLSGANTYSGATTVSAGTLTLNNVAGYKTTALSAASGATLSILMPGNATSSWAAVTDPSANAFNSVNAAITGAGLVTLGTTGGPHVVAGGGSGTMTTNMSAGGMLDVQSGQWAWGWARGSAATNNGSLNVASGAAYRSSDVAFQFDALTGSGTIGNAFNASAVTLTLGVQGTTNNATYGVSSNTATFSGVIASGEFYNDVTTSALNLVKTGSGTQILSGANTYTGTTTVSAGVLNIQSANALGSTAAGTSITSGAALQIQGGITTAAEALTLNGTGVSTDGALRNISGTNDFAGLVTLGSDTRINSDLGSLTLSNTGTITGATRALTVGGAGNTTINSIIGTTSGTLTKDGAGMLTLTGANTYTGATTISAGTLALSGGGRLADTTAVNLSGATGIFDISAINTTVEAIGSLAGVASSSVVLGTKDLQAGNANDTSFAGAISGSGGLIKVGSGKLTLSGTNAYNGSSGTQVRVGTLEVATGGSISHSTRNLHVGFSGNSGTLNLTGGSVSNAAGLIAADTNSTGTANVSAGTWTNSGNLSVGGNGTGVINLTGGTVHVGGGNGTVTLGSSASATGTLNIGTGAAVGTLNAATVTGGSGTAVVNFNHTGSVTFAPSLAGGLSVNKLAAGTTILSNTNTYTGATTISAGTLSVATIGNGGVAGNLGQASSAAGNLVFDGGTLQYTGSTATSDRAFTINAAKTATIDTANNLTLVGATGAATTGALT